MASRSRDSYADAHTGHVRWTPMKSSKSNTKISVTSFFYFEASSLRHISQRELLAVTHQTATFIESGAKFSHFHKPLIL